MNICSPEECTGCAACLNTCKVDAISFVADDEGFLHPSVDEAKCVHCGRCTKVCPQNYPPSLPQGPKQVFACWNKDESIRKASSSGGAFSALAETIISRGGVVYGAAFDVFPTVRHIRATTLCALSRLRGSKYLQSEIGQSFCSVRNDLDAGIPVLFSGTPCQVAGLYAFLEGRHDGRLFTIDLGCAGVPSPRLFSDYANWVESQFGSSITKYEFRNKDRGWHFHATSVSFLDGSLLRQRPNENPFYNGFLKHIFLRPSCSCCRYANPEHPADITLADFWGYSGYSEIDCDDGRGVSAMIVNSSNGLELLRAAEPALELFHRSLNDLPRGNQAFREPSVPSPARSRFWNDYRRLGLGDNLVKRYLTTTPKATRLGPITAKQRVKSVLKTVFGQVFCRRAKTAMKRLLHPFRCAVGFIRLRFLDRIALFVSVKMKPHIFVFVSPGHTNLGDNAQTLCIREFLEKYCPGRRIRFFTNDYIRDTHLSIIPFIRRISKPTDLVFLHSGYHMTDIWPNSERMHRFVVETFMDRPIVSFPQTIYYESVDARTEAARVFNAHPDNTIMCRDAISFATAKSMFPKCKLLLVPDMVTSKIGLYHFDEPRSGILVCKRNDKESGCSSEAFARIVTELSRIDAVTVSDTFAKDSWKAMHKDLKGYLEDVWRDYARYRLVVTDRYHGTIFSLIAATPVLVFPSTDHKVRSGLDWFPESFSDYVRFVPHPEDIPATAAEMIRKKFNHSLPPYFKETFFASLFNTFFPATK